MKHTKGPWITVKGHRGFVMIMEEANSCNFITGVDVKRYYDYCDRGVGNANAHLIAASPELLEACKSSLEAINQRLAIDGGKTGAFKAEIKAILSSEAVINKAEGGA